MSGRPHLTDRTAVALSFAFAWGAQAAFLAGRPAAGVTVLLCGWLPLLLRAGDGEVRLPGPPWLWLAAVGLAALAARVYRLDYVPPVWWDEAVETYDARCLAAGIPLEDLPGIHYHRGPLWTRIVEAWGTAFGFDIPRLRLASALTGTAFVLLASAAGARLGGGAAGVLAGFAAALHPWGLHLSRFVMGNMLVPLLGTLAVLAAGARLLPPFRRAAAAGAVAGLSMYGYAAAAHVPPLAAVAVLLLAPPGTALRRKLAAALLCLGVAAVAAFPLLLRGPGGLDKVRDVSVVHRPAAMLGNALASASLFHWRGDPDLRHQYPAESPALGAFLAPFFSLGLGLALAGAREPRNLLVLAWLALGLAPGIASSGGERNLFRMVGALPPAMILAGRGAAAVARAFGPRLGPALALLLIAAGAAGDLGTYFAGMSADRATAVWYRTFSAEAARDLRGLAGGKVLSFRSRFTLAHHPVERNTLFAEIREGRVVAAEQAGTGGLPLVKTYFDPYGQPQAALLAGPAGKGRLAVCYRTVLDIGVEGDGLMVSGRARESVALFRTWTGIMPGSIVLRERLGFAYLKAGRPGDALAAFREVAARGTVAPSTLNGMASALYRLGRYAEAERALERALALDPGNAGFMADLETVRRAAAAKKGR